MNDIRFSCLYYHVIDCVMITEFSARKLMRLAIDNDVIRQLVFCRASQLSL